MPTLRFVKCLAAAAWLTPLFAQPATYQNPGAPLEKRVDDLLGRLTLEEKVSQLMNDSAAIDRLGIPQYNWWNECLHGGAAGGHLGYGLAVPHFDRHLRRSARQAS